MRRRHEGRLLGTYGGDDVVPTLGTTPRTSRRWRRGVGDESHVAKEAVEASEMCLAGPGRAGGETTDRNKGPIVGERETVTSRGARDVKEVGV